jgi:outer membrane protein, multidrug efflux system
LTRSDVRQAEELVYAGATKVTDLERQIAQQENAVSILRGGNPGDISRGLKLIEQPHAPEVPVGLASSLLERRPDILQAEASLIAANARIGVARAAYFPSISLTGTAGFESSALNSLMTVSAGLWTLAGSITQPIFQGGRLKANVRYAEAQHEQMVLEYQQTIKVAFKDVSNSLVAYRKYREYRIPQKQLVESANDAARLSHERFRAGTAAYLEVLTNETNAFSYELQLAQARGNELTSLVELYQALGGGWQ